MIAGDTTLQLHEQRILAVEHHCRRILGQGSNGTELVAKAQPAEESIAPPSNGEAAREQARKLIELTARLFPPGAISVQCEYDPDFPHHQYLVFDAGCEGEFAEIFRREDEWHQEARKIVSEPLGVLCLCVYPK